MLMLMLVILMLFLMLLNLITGYADADTDLCIRIMSLYCMRLPFNIKSAPNILSNNHAQDTGIYNQDYCIEDK